MGGDAKEGTLKKLIALGEIAKDLGYTQAQLALAWAISNKDVSTCILGFTKLSQVEENLKSLELYQKWTRDIEKRIRDVLGNEPEAIIDFRKWSPLENRRSEQLAVTKQ